MHFYPQYKYEDFCEMNICLYSAMIDGMNRLKHINRLYQMESSSYPHIKDDERKKIHRNIYKNAYPENFEQKIVTTEDLERMFF